ncbi:MAG: hypothetical protein NTY19_11660 [Planctomycetota bacterium]|nr:hypothetical protein [Planctomycetota bacterium]
MVRHDAQTIKEAARGCWREKFGKLAGLSSEILDGQHHPCPRCGGTDRFRMVDESAGALYCNKCFDHNNGDGFAALQWLTGRTFPQVVADVAGLLGIDTNGDTPTRTKPATVGTSAGTGNGNAGWYLPCPPPADRQRATDGKKRVRTYATAADAMAVYARMLGERLHDTLWEYLDANGQCVGFVLRWNMPDGSKEIRPVSLAGSRWTCGGMPEPRPLYRLPGILRADMATPVYVVEGEKAAEELWQLGLTATTSANGSKSARKTDWSLLAGRQVVIMPDNDEAGERYLQAVVGILRTLVPAPTVRVVRLPGLPAKGDAADFVLARKDVAA